MTVSLHSCDGLNGVPLASELDTAKLSAMVRKKRGRQGLRQTATEIGDVSAATISRVEQGRVPDLETFLRLCDWLGVSPDQFTMSGTGTSAAASPSTPDLVAAHLRADRTLRPETAEALSSVIRLAYEAAVRGELDEGAEH